MPLNQMALLVMDMQEAVVQRYVKSPEILTPFQRAIAAGRSANMHVIFVRVAFREGYPEISPRNKMFSAVPARGGNQPDALMRIHSSLEPRSHEMVITKLRVSAFTGSDLEVVLRSQEIRTLVLTGIATSGVVLSTLREAADKDYGLIVLSDACLDADAEVHRVLIEKVFPRQAEVMSVDAWTRSL